MLNALSLRNFKSYVTGTLDLAPLTLLIGANASGKSNLLEALRLSSWLAHRHRLDRLNSDLGAGDLTVRGGRTSDLVRWGEDEISFRFSISHLSLEQTLRLGDDGVWRVEAETLRDARDPGGAEPLYETEANTKDGGERGLKVVYRTFESDARRPFISCSDLQAIYTQLDSPARFRTPEAQRALPEAAALVEASLSEMRFFDFRPHLMRGYSHSSDRNLTDNGSNVSSVLASIVRSGNKSRVLDIVRSLPEQRIEDLDFIRTPRDEVMVQLHESRNGGPADKVDAPLLSDGTLRVLALAAGLLTAAEGSTIVIEEIDNGVHPSRVGPLLAKLLSIAKERGLRVLLTTHNPALVNEVPIEALDDIVCCYRDSEDGSSALVKLSELDRYPDLLARGGLGDMMASGFLESVVKDKTTREERIEKGLQWIHSLRAEAE